MNCPFHILVFRSRQRSYRELPLRLFEFGTVYRYEKSGVVHGLTRVRGMTQDDAHIFCTREQMGDELGSLLTFVLDLLRDFGLEDFYLELSTKPPGQGGGHRRGVGRGHRGAAGGGRGSRPRARHGRGRRRLLRPQDLGAGPRRHRPATGRCPPSNSTSRRPKRFGIEYVGADNARHRPVMIHRALFGSVERFFAILLEHYAGALPTWLMPVQVVVLPVRDDHDDYARDVAAALRRGRGAGRGRHRRRAAQRPHPPVEAREGALHPRRGRRRRGGGHGGGERPVVGTSRARRGPRRPSSPR